MSIITPNENYHKTLTKGSPRIPLTTPPNPDIILWHIIMTILKVITHGESVLYQSAPCVFQIVGQKGEFPVFLLSRRLHMFVSLFIFSLDILILPPDSDPLIMCIKLVIKYQ